MPRNLRKALSLTAFLFLLAALFPIQKQLVSVLAPGSISSTQDYYLTVLRARQITLLWQPLADLNRYPSYGGHSPRTELDWESCTLEFVIIVSIGFLYFGWLERPR